MKNYFQNSFLETDDVTIEIFFSDKFFLVCSVLWAHKGFKVLQRFGKMKALGRIFLLVTLLMGVIHANQANNSNDKTLLKLSTEQLAEKFFPFQLYELLKYIIAGPQVSEQDYQIDWALKQIDTLNKKEKQSLGEKVRNAFLMPQQNECYLFVCERRQLEEQRAEQKKE
ncbi:MAG: hypothetical protein KC505_04425 [Myxococcales bacterium]|nr:hypothetical protein [Myxococcales bacterium]USN51139.1 MAG: hypothetical protein H6731_01640 [Myxococcales bacterium]